MLLSYVILTHNRRESLLRTLRVLHDTTPLSADQWEAIVVDNASTDGTAKAVAAQFPSVRLARSRRNEGSPARNIGAREAQGEFLIFLDDDSYPCEDAVTQSIQYLQRHHRVGMVGGRVWLPDGSEDAAALPCVLPACGMCVRAEAFRAVGGFCDDFFRQAEEYDLIFRMLATGWDVRRLESIVYGHEKVATSRNSALIQHNDLRNNLVLAARFLPRDLRTQYRRDWLRRYVALARHDGNADGLKSILAESRSACVREAHHGRQVLDAALIEVLFQFRHQVRQVRQWAQTMDIRRVVIADNTKNLYATWRACQLAGLTVLAVSDNHPAYAGMRYRGIAILSEHDAAALEPEGVVLSNINPAKVQRRATSLADRFLCHILTLWQPARDAERTLGSPQSEHYWRPEQYPRMAV